jgi:hypothetical protein
VVLWSSARCSVVSTIVIHTIIIVITPDHAGPPAATGKVKAPTLVSPTDVLRCWRNVWSVASNVQAQAATSGIHLLLLLPPPPSQVFSVGLCPASRLATTTACRGVGNQGSSLWECWMLAKEEKKKTKKKPASERKSRTSPRTVLRVWKLTGAWQARAPDAD